MSAASVKCQLRTSLAAASCSSCSNACCLFLVLSCLACAQDPQEQQAPDVGWGPCRNSCCNHWRVDASQSELRGQHGWQLQYACTRSASAAREGRSPSGRWPAQSAAGTQRCSAKSRERQSAQRAAADRRLPGLAASHDVGMLSADSQPPTRFIKSSISPSSSPSSSYTSIPRAACRGSAAS